MAGTLDIAQQNIGPHRLWSPLWKGDESHYSPIEQVLVVDKALTAMGAIADQHLSTWGLPFRFWVGSTLLGGGPRARPPILPP